MLYEHRGKLIRLFLYALFLAALMLVIVADANTGPDKFFEDSWTERAQKAIFLLLAVGLFVLSFRLQQVSILATMFAGFFLLAFIRELDALLEQNIGTGTWQVLVTIVFIAMVYQARRHWAELKNQVSDHVETYSFGLFIAGFLTAFIFSRLIGNEELWMAIMEEGYRRNIKNAVEESTELLGDALFLFSGIEFTIRYAASISKQTSSSAQVSG